MKCGKNENQAAFDESPSNPSVAHKNLSTETVDRHRQTFSYRSHRNRQEMCHNEFLNAGTHHLLTAKNELSSDFRRCSVRNGI
jgi:hypothetical protein